MTAFWQCTPFDGMWQLLDVAVNHFLPILVHRVKVGDRPFALPNRYRHRRTCRLEYPGNHPINMANFNSRQVFQILFHFFSLANSYNS
jgi:hypothetical protein